MYQVFCLKGTPPETLEEQEKCFRSKSCCWRLSKKRKQAQHTAAEEPVTAAGAASH
ncbi:hypothetical protein KSZ_40350 [Dictyobacter formicarum]|uniref:Uncharacterized protein n=1 Tax=Dictyobacter formicarum TaxID=2778368 RepID=A0ABQ3VK17_9CHLR|nr:hypothetical protein KSZ_40350 [Dictyobacter formicarum]